VHALSLLVMRGRGVHRVGEIRVYIRRT